MPKFKIPDFKNMSELPPDLQEEVKKNSEAMHNFYSMSTDKREAVLDDIMKTNEKLDKAES